MKGFTVLEMVIVVVILSIVGTLLILSLSTFLRISNLVEAQTNIVGILYDARARTLAGVGNDVYGVHFDQTTNSVTLFKGPVYVQGAASNSSYTLPGRVVIQSISGPTDIIFSRLSANTSPATVTLQLSGDAAVTREIIILASGNIQ